MGLTAKRVSKLLRKGAAGRHHDGDGLSLKIVNQRNASWVLRYQLAGRERWMGLGSAKTFSLSEARERARREKQKLADRIDPLEARRGERIAAKLAAAKAMSFAEAAKTYHQQHAGKWRSVKHAQQFINSLEQYAYPVIGALPVSSIDTNLVLKVLERPIPAERGYPAGPFWQARPETAARVRSRIGTVLDWAKARGLRTGDNPAALAIIGKALPARTDVAKVEHHAALPYRQLPAFVQQLKQRQGSAARALEFTILVCARTGETINAKHNEFNLDERIWTVPANRMKAGREHRVALSAAVIDLLKSLPRDGDLDKGFIFIGSTPGSGLSNMAMTAVLKRMGHGDITVHGLRSAFKDWARERTNFPNEISEIALAHRVGDKTEQAYARGDLLKKRYQLAEQWAKYCLTAPSKQIGDTVVPLNA
jgi:integrase